jgi:predicted nucleotidyltransferase
MRAFDEIKEILDKHKNELKEKYGVVKIGVFGSFARAEQRENSDIDILVEFERPIGLKFVDLAYYLEEILCKKVEVVTLPALKQKPRLWESVKEDLIYV